MSATAWGTPRVGVKVTVGETVSVGVGRIVAVLVGAGVTVLRVVGLARGKTVCAGMAVGVGNSAGAAWQPASKRFNPNKPAKSDNFLKIFIV
jgi:hypothetical protein